MSCESAITGPDSFKTTDKKVCSVTNSTPANNIKKYLKAETQLVLFDTYQKCIDALNQSTVDAVTTDNVILLGFISKNEGKFKLAGDTFTKEPYGVGMNKDDARKKWGEEQVHIWRRSYDIAPPGGESLKDTGARVWPYYLHELQPHVLRGGTVLVAAHGNSLRALFMALEGMSGEEIVKLELGTGVPMIYRLNADSTLKSKEILADA